MGTGIKICITMSRVQYGPIHCTPLDPRLFCAQCIGPYWTRDMAIFLYPSFVHSQRGNPPLSFGRWTPEYSYIPVPIVCAQCMGRTEPVIWLYSCTHRLCTANGATHRSVSVRWTPEYGYIPVPIACAQCMGPWWICDKLHSKLCN